MKINLRTLSIGIASVLTVSCASQPQDIDRMRSLVSQAESGPDGVCVVALHEAALSLSEAQTILAKADSEGVDDFEYRRGIAAAENAISARKTVASQCTTRTSALALQSEEMQSEIVGTQIGLLQTQAAVAKLYRKTERLPGVTFKRDSAELKMEAKPILDVIADRVVKEDKKVEIAGHTSSTGSAEHNLNLSQARAEAVREYLISRGVKSNKVVAKGYGMSQPIATNDTQAGRNANKRVEIRYLK